MENRTQCSSVWFLTRVPRMLTVRFSLGRAVCCGHPAIRTVATGYGSTAVDTVLTFGKHGQVTQLTYVLVFFLYAVLCI